MVLALRSGARISGSPHGSLRGVQLKDTVILTVFNRIELVLMNVLTGLAKQDLTDTEILILDDGSTIDYSEFWPVFSMMPLRIVKGDSVAAGALQFDGHNNPAWVNNVALSLAHEDGRVFWLSSDCILPPGILDRARAWVDRGAVYTPRVIDMDTGNLYLGKGRVFPMMWFMGAKLSDCVDCGGFDEEYIKGMAFEDCDFVGRLFRQTGKLVIDQGATVFHQSHPAAYMADKGDAYRRSEEYTKTKWGGRVPWAENGRPFGWSMKEIGNVIALGYLEAEKRVGAGNGAANAT